MDTSTKRAYKRSCFQGRGLFARWMDHAFFSILGGVCLFILTKSMVLSVVLLLATVLFLALWDRRRWCRFERQLWHQAVKTIRREIWLKREAELIRQAGGIVLYPTPDKDELIGLCLRMGQGTEFHCFGEPQPDLSSLCSSLGCRVSFHPWGEGEAPERKQVIERLKNEAPKHDKGQWRDLLRLPGNRYLMTGCLLLLFSVWLRRALYWRLLGSLCLLIGGLRVSFHRILKT